VRSTYRVLAPDDPTAALGAPIGEEQALTEAFEETLKKTNATRAAFLDVDRAPTETVLTRFCGDVAKVTFQLRLNGDRIDEELLKAHDSSLRASIDTIIGGGLTDEAWQHATLGVSSAGGLGMRDAQSVARSAFFASRIASRPHVLTLAKHLADSGIGASTTVMDHFDRRTDSALTGIVSGLDATAGLKLLDKLDQVAEDVMENWKTLFTVDLDAPASRTPNHQPCRPGAGVGLLPNDEAGDDARPDAPSITTPLKIQRLIYAAVDERKVAGLRNSMHERLDVAGLRRIDDLSLKKCDHTWLWALSLHKGPVRGRQMFMLTR